MRRLHGVRGAVTLFGLAALVPVFVRDAFFLDTLILILLWGAAAAAWNVAGGYAGQISLGHSVFFGLGAYSAALLGTKWSVSPWIALVVGAALAVTMGVLIGFLSNRLRGPYFVLATIACSQVFLIAGSRWRGFTSGSEGIAVPFRPGLLDARLRGQARVGLSDPGPGGRCLSHPAATSSGRAAAISSPPCARTRTRRCRSGCRHGG